jgi:UDP-N-acetylglucosamine--N-acetylmuramyl-(pentapeptide) pyrophosphoryl-undecaprenol N-acetylglucosamine transferase
LSPQFLAERLEDYAKDRDTLLDMAKAARQLARLNATKAVADLCEEVASV